MEQAALNPLVLALIGTPTLAGIYFRWKRRSSEGFRVNIVASCLVMSAVAIGYGFATFDRPNPFFTAYSHGISVVLIGALVAGGMLWLLRTSEIENYIALPFALILYWLAAWLFCNYVPTAYAMPLAALALFCTLGVINALLGTLAIGFAVSATLHSLFASGSLEFIFLWKDLFELLNVTNGGIKLMIIGTTCLAGSGEILTWLASRLLEGDV